MTHVISPTAVRRPERWDNPLDVSLTDADVAWLRTRPPFSSLNPAAFPKATPLEGILRNDCRVLRVEPGEIIVREGDYGSSAFLVLAGNVRVFISHLQPEQLGRRDEPKISWAEALRRWLTQSKHAETRTLQQVAINKATRLASVDDRPAIFLQDFAAVMRHHQTTLLGPGELFGEVAAMYRTPRAATVIADTEATLVEIRWQGLRLLRRDPKFADQLEQHYRSHWLRHHLQEIPLFRYVPSDAMDKIVAATEMKSHGRIEWNTDFRKAQQLSAKEQIEQEPLVAQEGSFPTALIVIRSGFARTTRQFGSGHQTTAYLGAGQLFGLDEVVQACCSPESPNSVALQQSLRAVGFVDSLHIPIEVVCECILPYVRRDELPAEVRHLIENKPKLQGDRRQRSRTERVPQVAPGTSADKLTGHASQYTGRLEFLVENRLFNGRQAMVIDLNRCTRCDECVKACAATHDGNPRFVRDGMKHLHLQFVQACMHCTDPVCMIGCPTGAIHRQATTGIVKIEESICVGCGTCASSCPYQNIRMTPISDTAGQLYVDSKTGSPIQKATKCDLCHHLHSGPACVSACPHDALVRISLAETEPLEHWLEKRCA